MSVKFTCKCGESYQLDDSFANKNMICKRCKMIIDLPAAKYDTPELAENEIPTEEALSAVHKRLYELRIASKKRFFSASLKTPTLADSISKTIDCSCGYRGFAIHDSRVRLIHLMFFFFGIIPGWVILALIEYSSTGYYCPICNRKHSRAIPLPTIPAENVNIIIEAAQEKYQATRSMNIGCGIILGILLLAFLMFIAIIAFTR